MWTFTQQAKCASPDARHQGGGCPGADQSGGLGVSPPARAAVAAGHGGPDATAGGDPDGVPAAGGFNQPGPDWRGGTDGDLPGLPAPTDRDPRSLTPEEAELLCGLIGEWLDAQISQRGLGFREAARRLQEAWEGE